MKFLFPLVAMLNAVCADEGPAVTTVTTSMLRGSKVTRRRTVLPQHTEEGLKPDNRHTLDQLVDTPKTLRGGDDDERANKAQEHLSIIIQEHLLQHHGHGKSEHTRGHQTHHTNAEHSSHRQSQSNNGHVRGHATHNQHFQKHEDVEHPHLHQHKENKRQEPLPQHQQSKKRRVLHDKSMYTLPTGLSEHFNETLYDELHNAPFDIYEHAMGHYLPEDDVFPVFSVPSWRQEPGVFSGFNKQAEPLIFEHSQVLLNWTDIMGASTVTGQLINDYIADNNFHANLIIGKAFKDVSHNFAFIGLLVSYWQYGAKKNVLVPFGHLEDFFNDASEKHLSDPETRHIEAEALHEMLEQKLTNSSEFYHPTFAHTQGHRDRLEDLEIIHFQKLFQLLIRRSFLFSYGYADCLMQEPDYLRECLDDTFQSVVHMETSVRGALEEQIVEQLAEINESFLHEHVTEACISFEGGIIGTEGCEETNDLSMYATAFGSF